MRNTFGLLGEKLGHSFSPMIHSYLGDYEYTLHEVSPDALDAFMTGRQFNGINVTIPYKQAVIPYCASLSDEARAIGSVNTIIKDEKGLLHGHNTDYYGFCEMLRRGKINPARKKVLVLGSGGASRTVIAALQRMDTREIVTISRRGENNYNNLERHFDAEIIVNTTPVGMYPDNGNSPLSLEGFRQLTGFADLIYNPARTKLLIDAGRFGIPFVNGLTMLVAQAGMASHLFTNGPAKPEIIGTIVDTIEKRTRNIALIGMPGCGKSTVGKVLAALMERPFADIDELIEAEAGKSIAEIFAEDGEESFRKLETSILSDESKKSGIVIAAGGGVVTRQENYDLLHQNSLIVYIKRDLSQLITDGRPLSQTVGIQSLAEKRLPLYEEWSDCCVCQENSPLDTPERTAERILEALK